MKALPRNKAVLIVAAFAAACLAITVWAATVASIPRGYIGACALTSVAIVWLAFWRPKFTVPIAAAIIGLTSVMLRREYYGQPGFLSVRSLQSMAIWASIFAAVVLIRVMLIDIGQRSGRIT